MLCAWIDEPSLLFLAFPFTAFLTVALQPWQAVVIAVAGVFVVLVLVGFIFGGIKGISSVPASAVREMLDRCTGSESREIEEELSKALGDAKPAGFSLHWMTVTFDPKVSLEAASQRVGRRLTQADRVKDFQEKCVWLAPKHPEVVAFYSAKKGCLIAPCDKVMNLERKYGRRRIDNWIGFLRAAAREGLGVMPLDDSVFGMEPFERPPDWATKNPKDSQF